MIVIGVLVLGLVLFFFRNRLRLGWHGLKRSFRYQNKMRLRRLRGWRPSGGFEIVEVFFRMFYFSLTTMAISYMILAPITEWVFKLFRGGK